MSETESASPEPPKHGYLQSDEPIKRRSEDLLDRAPFAEVIAEQLLHTPPKQPFVVALDGAWGSGKTSVLNMIEEVVVDRSETVVLHFNPWLFSGTEELVVRFLHELATQLREVGEAKEERSEQLRRIGDRLTEYGNALAPLGWMPVLGGTLARASVVLRSAGGLGKKAPPSALALHARLRAALLELDRRVLVVVDDLDRIEDAQIRDVVRLIKLVADFPNVSYLLGYDSERVAVALGPEVHSGRAYLEKIVQVTHRLPETSDAVLLRVFGAELEETLSTLEHGPFSQHEWANVFHTVIRPYFRTLRDVRRYLNAVPLTIRLLGREVALVDALALEALRIFAPGAFALMPGMVATLTAEGSDAWARTSPERDAADAAAVAALLDAAAPHRNAVEELLRRLFPPVSGHVGGQRVLSAGAVYRRGRRVADPDVLRLYLRQTLPQGMAPAALVQEAFDNLADRERLTLILESLDSDRLENLLTRLRDYEAEFDAVISDAAIDVLINQIPRLREDRRGMWDFGAHFVATGLVYGILERVPNETERLQMVERALPRIEQLSGREELIDIVGHRENTGHKLVSAAEADRLYREQNEAVLAASPERLRHERGLAHLLYRATEHTQGARARIREFCNDDAVFLQLLRSGLSERRGIGEHDVVARSAPDLPWSMFVEILGDEELVKARVADIGSTAHRAQLDERTRLALETAARYATGELTEPRLSGPLGSDDDP